MRKPYLLVTIFLVLILPAFLINYIQKTENAPQQQDREETENSEFTTVLNVQMGDTITAMDLETYLLGVLLGEIPASFETETIKAQAVASRTYTLRKLKQQSKHRNADICTDAACCQAYMSESVYISERGTRQDIQKIRNGLMATSGQVLLYEGDLIEATYFSSSGGMTEDAKAVWGTSVPYLQSVISPEDKENPYYDKETVFTVEAFLTCLGLPADFQLSQADMEISYTNGGGVDQLVIDGCFYSGTQLRALLKLPSTAMRISVQGTSVVIATRGNGHRVGMSQYGADAMAVSGNDYRTILQHYYPGTSLAVLDAEQMKGIFDKA